MDWHQLYKIGFDESKKIIKLNDEQMKELKALLLEMLSDFDKFANEYGINYSLSGGSVLGTIRHNGFIPWDDDVDINIPRADYDKCRKIFQTALGNKYQLCSPEDTHDHGMLCAQIKKKGTIYRSFNELSKGKNDCGICIDIFIVENTYNNVFLRNIHGCIALAMGYISTCRKTYNDLPYLIKYLDKDSPAAKRFTKKASIGKFFSWLSLDQVTKIANHCYSFCKNKNSKYVTIPAGRGHYFKEMHKRSDLCKYKEHNFEHIKTKIPANYNEYLTSLYGKNYMTLPPVEKRETHPLMEIDFGK